MNFNYKKYRDDRYKTWGNSGKGSYWANAHFKAIFINNFCKEHKLKTAVEVGCWDWNNLVLYDFRKYLGLDVSKTIIDKCKEIFESDKSKRFDVLDEWIDLSLCKADVSLCLDVTYHIFPREEWERTIDDVINLWVKYAIFYSFLNPSGHAAHINDYNFIEFIDKYCNGKWYTYKIYEDKAPESQSRFVIIDKSI